jgi:hypothetical protein
VPEFAETLRTESRERIQPAEYCGCYVRYDDPRVSRAVLNTSWSMLWVYDVRLWMLQEFESSSRWVTMSRCYRLAGLV